MDHTYHRRAIPAIDGPSSQLHNSERGLQIAKHHSAGFQLAAQILKVTLRTFRARSRYTLVEGQRLLLNICKCFTNSRKYSVNLREGVEHFQSRKKFSQRTQFNVTSSQVLSQQLNFNLQTLMVYIEKHNHNIHIIKYTYWEDTLLNPEAGRIQKDIEVYNGHSSVNFNHNLAIACHFPRS